MPYLVPGNICFFFVQNSSLKFLSAKFLVICSAIAYFKYSIYKIATSSSTVMVLEELDDEGSDTVFHA